MWSGVFFIQQEFSGLQNFFLRQVFVAKSKTIQALRNQASRILVIYVYITDCFGCNFTKKIVKVTGHCVLRASNCRVFVFLERVIVGDLCSKRELLSGICVLRASKCQRFCS